MESYNDFKQWTKINQQNEKKVNYVYVLLLNTINILWYARTSFADKISFDFKYRIKFKAGLSTVSALTWNMILSKGMEPLLASALCLFQQERTTGSL